MSLEVQLVLTEKCNFKCDYCYLSLKKTRMTVDKFKDFYYNQLKECMELHRCDTYHIVFFGGEPLLEMKLIDEIHDIVYLKDYCKGICDGFKVVTNGSLLTEEICKEFITKDIKISVSYDGLWQDENREGQLSENSILRNPILLQKYVDKVHCMVKPENISSIVENFNYFIDLNLTPNFTLVEDNIWSDKDVEIFEKQIELLVKRNIETVKEGKNIIAGFFTQWITKIIKPTVSTCSIGKSVSLFPDGKIYPCARYGNQDQHILYDKDFKRFNIHEVGRLGNKANWGCGNCEIIAYCNTGCPAVQEEFGGLIPQLCDFYKILFKNTNEFIKVVGGTYLIRLHIENIMKDIGVT